MNPLDVLQKHEIQGKDSCVSWGLEFILKVHHKIKIDEYPIQKLHPCDLGFDDKADKLLRPYGIIKDDKHFEWSDFEKSVEAELKANRYPIFSLPISVNLDIFTQKFADFNVHICVAAIVNHQTKYMTRLFEKSEIFDIPFQPFYNFLRSQIKPDYKIHCLLYSLE